MPRNDPDVLEAEADALFAEMQGESGTTPSGETDDQGSKDGAQADEAGSEDTPGNDPDPADETPPDDPSDTGAEAEGEDEAAGDGDDPDVEALKSENKRLERELGQQEERYKNAQARMTKATQEASALRREVENLQSEIAGLRAKPTDQASTGDPELEKVMEDYGEIVGPIISELRNLRAKVGQTEESIARKEQETTEQAHWRVIREAHPDIDDLTSSDDWQGWIERQGPTRRLIAERGTAEEVVDLLTTYKDAMGISKADPDPTPDPDPEPTPEQSQNQGKRRVEEARAQSEPRVPRARKPDPNAGKKIWSMSEVQRMSLSEYEKYEAEIDKAISEGRVSD